MSDMLAPLLSRLGIDALVATGWLPFAALLIVIAVGVAALRQRRAITWPAVVEAEVAGARRFEPVPALAVALRAATFAALALVVARPVTVDRAPPEPGLGLDLVLVLDTSGSMRALDAVVDDGPKTRLELAKRVVARFAKERVAEGDRVGLVVFGETAFTLCPLTSDGALLEAALARVEVGMAGEATALGDALALAVKRAGGADAEGMGRLVVLLTDGRNNAGAVPLDVAADVAASAGVRVHTVGIGTQGKKVPVALPPGAPATGLRFERHDADLDTLMSVSLRTAGRAFAARRSGDLAAVYDEIDSLERKPRPLPPRIRETDSSEPLLAAAAGLLVLEIVIARIWRRAAAVMLLGSRLS